MFAIQIEELNLDSCDASQITGLTDQYTNLETLTLSNNGLTSLKGFPSLPNLRKVHDYCTKCQNVTDIDRCSVKWHSSGLCSMCKAQGPTSLRGPLGLN